MEEPSSERVLSLAAANDQSITSLVFPVWGGGEQWEGESLDCFKNALRNTTHVKSVLLHIPVGPLPVENELDQRIWIDFCKVLGQTSSVTGLFVQLVGRSEDLEIRNDIHIERAFARIYYLVSRLGEIKSLSISGTCTEDENEELVDDVFPWTDHALVSLSAALKRGPTRLEVFKLEHYSCSDSLAYKNLFESLASLQHLKHLVLDPYITWIDEDDGSGVFSNIVCFPASLESLTLSNFRFNERDGNNFHCALEKLKENGSGLEKLEFRECSHLWPSSLSCAAGCVSTLIVSDVVWRANGLDALTAVVQRPNRLHEIRFSEVDLNLEESSFQQAEQCVQNYFQELKRSNLSHFRWMNSKALAHFPSAFQFLPFSEIVPQLRFANCDLNREAMEELIKRIPWLKLLHVQGSFLDEALLLKLRCAISLRTGSAQSCNVVQCSNTSLKDLRISLDALENPRDRLDWAASFVEECDLRHFVVFGIKKGLPPSSDEQLNMDRLLDALRGNYTLTFFGALRFDARNFEGLDDLGLLYTEHIIRTITKLNKVGRRYLADKAPSRRKGVVVLASVSDDLDCLFYHLLENPTLCCFARDQATRLGGSKRSYAEMNDE